MSAVVRAVIFDLGGVVLGSPFEAIAEYEKGIGCTPNTINKIIGASGEDGAFAKLERGEITVEQFALPFSRDCATVGYQPHSIDGSTLIEAISNACTPRPLMLDALQLLKTEPSIRTAALTNNFTFEHGGAFEESTRTLVPLFDKMVESCVEGVRKPDPAIYRIACDRLGVEPARCVFLDDIGRNLKPAQALGMQTIKCALEDRSGAHALADLSKHLGGDIGRRLQQVLHLARL